MRNDNVAQRTTFGERRGAFCVLRSAFCVLKVAPHDRRAALELLGLLLLKVIVIATVIPVAGFSSASPS
jgi:hypothetical protein